MTRSMPARDKYTDVIFSFKIVIEIIEFLKLVLALDVKKTRAIY